MTWSARLAGFFYALGAPFRVLGAAFRVLMDPEGRRAWALVLLAGGGVAMTVYAGVGLYLVREHADYAFYLALAALGLILVVLTGFAGLLVRRTIKGSVLGGSIEISDEQVQKIADKVVEATPPPVPPPAPTVVVQAGAVVP